jgi:hypothetical protein
MKNLLNRQLLAVALAVIGLCSSVVGHADTAVPTVAEAQAIVGKGLVASKGLESYQATLQRAIRRDGKMKSEKMFIRREGKGTIFLKYITGRSATLQVLFSEGKFDGKIVTRPPGLFFDFIPIQLMDPKDPRVTGKEKRPLTDAGIGHMIESFAKDLADAEVAGRARVISLAPAPGMKDVTRLEVELAVPASKYPRTAMYFRADGLPIGVELFPAAGPASETYHYTDIQPNPAKDDAVFLKNIDARILNDYYKKI